MLLTFFLASVTLVCAATATSVIVEIKTNPESTMRTSPSSGAFAVVLTVGMTAVFAAGTLANISGIL